MNDLIRRKDVLALFPTNDCSDKMVGLYERVLDIPTAYNVDKVAAELKEWTFNADINIGDGTTLNHNLITSENAIDIVRKGGVE